MTWPSATFGQLLRARGLSVYGGENWRGGESTAKWTEVGLAITSQRQLTQVSEEQIPDCNGLQTHNPKRKNTKRCRRFALPPHQMNTAFARHDLRWIRWSAFSNTAIRFLK